MKYSNEIFYRSSQLVESIKVSVAVAVTALINLKTMLKKAGLPLLNILSNIFPMYCVSMQKWNTLHTCQLVQVMAQFNKYYCLVSISRKLSKVAQLLHDQLDIQNIHSYSDYVHILHLSIFKILIDFIQGSK